MWGSSLQPGGVAAWRRALLIASVLALVVVWGYRAAAQPTPTARFETTNLEPLLGEQFTISLVVSVPTNYEVQFPPFGQDWGENFSVIALDDPTRDTDGEGAVHRLPMTVAVWQLGDVETPPTAVAYLDGNGNESRLAVEPLSLFVPGTLDTDPELITSRQTVYLWYPLSVMIGVGVGIVAVLSGSSYLVYRRFAQRTGGRIVGRQTPKTLTQRAVYDLNRIRADAPDIVAQYEQMGDRLRTYIHDLFDVPTQDRTTSELIEHIHREKLMTRERLKELRFLLEQADLAKFAPAEVYAPKELSMIQLAVQWVQSVEREVSG